MVTPYVITGLGAVSSLGRGVDRMWQAMAAGEHGIRPIERFDASELGSALGGVVPDRNGRAWQRAGSRLCVELAAEAAGEAWRRAGLDGAAVDPVRVALVFGTSIADQDVPLHRMTAAVADQLGVAGPRLTVSTACSSAANALGIGVDLLRSGAADLVIAGGADVLTPLVLAGFSALGVLSRDPCAPFSSPPGTTLGEGAGFAVLERLGDAARRGARTDLILRGYGIAGDGFHDTGPDPTGAGVARAMRGALAAAGVAPDEVDYVNAHGTGTAANDPAEWRAIQAVLGERAASVPVSSSKSFLGHGQGAAGVLEAIATILCLERGAVPPTRNHRGARPNSPPDPVAQDTPRPAEVRLALCNSSAFGGANCALVIEHRPGPQDRGAAAAREVRPVYLTGVGALGPHGHGLDALADALGAGRPVRGPAAPYRLESIAPSVDPRGMDPCTRHLVAAARLALDDDGVRLRGPARVRTGLVIGLDRVSPESRAALMRTIEAGGMRCLSATLFARMVLSAPVGTCSRLLSLKGPLSTVSAAGASGLIAALYAAELLAHRDDADRVVAGAVEEIDPERDGQDGVDGAACAVLAAAPPAAGRRARLAGWAIAGPGRLAEAADAALARAGLAAGDLDAVLGPVPASAPARRHIDTDAIFGAGRSATSAMALAAAGLLLRRGRLDAALICAAGDGTADAAAVLVAEEGDQDAT